MCFYAALHWIEYYACQKGEPIQSKYQHKSPHDSRRDYVYDLAAKLKNTILKKSYDNLEAASRKSRYLEGIQYDSAVDYFKVNRNRPEVSKSFQDLQKIKDILNKKLNKK